MIITLHTVVVVNDNDATDDNDNDAVNDADAGEILLRYNIRR